ncbi:MAG: hypothetical protein KY428_13000 [Bacteroidetes bacterium]|nr:hypothetical protein [Bacteroidota bacterium]
MANLIKQVDAIESAMRKGWPEGTYELHREIPILFARIKELEDALVPFARVSLVERRSNPNHNPEMLVSVYLKHCNVAFEKIDSQQAGQVKVDDFFSVPAEA